MNTIFSHPLWEDTFASRQFGKYPSEEVIRFFFSSRHAVGPTPTVLDIGCGAGAAAWFLAHNGGHVTAMDGAPSALKQLEATLEEFCSPPVTSLLGDITCPAKFVKGTFDLLVDHYAIYANHEDLIRRALNMYREILAPSGRFLSCMFGRKCAGRDAGERLGLNTFAAIPTGIHKGTGTVTLWTQQEAENLFLSAGFKIFYRESQIHDRNGLIFEKLIFHLGHS